MTSKFNGIRLTLAVTGLFYTLTGLALLILPTWFLTYIGHFPPFNRHYMGDTAAFVLPLGVGILVAARKPQAHRGIILITAAASVLHALNHAYDDWLLGSPLSHWLSETIPLFILSGLLVLIYQRISQ